MNRERAEAHLRLLAEEELRRATTSPSDGTADSSPEDAASGTETLAGRPAAMPAGRGWSADHAVTQLYSVHHQALLRMAALLVRDAHLAEEVVQESFIAMHRS